MRASLLGRPVAARTSPGPVTVQGTNSRSSSARRVLHLASPALSRQPSTKFAPQSDCATVDVPVPRPLAGQTLQARLDQGRAATRAHLNRAPVNGWIFADWKGVV